MTLQLLYCLRMRGKMRSQRVTDEMAALARERDMSMDSKVKLAVHKGMINNANLRSLLMMWF
jgi:hypothetical protein